MKFKVLINGIKGVATAVQKHAFSIGYEWVGNLGTDTDYEYLAEHDYLYFQDDMKMFWQTIGSKWAFHCETMNLEDFLMLTPEDVRVEPEKWYLTLRFESKAPSWAESNRIAGCLTRDQIDRIKEIMNEV